jgi:acetyl-CoA carboxylase carboxyltransferase component
MCSRHLGADFVFAWPTAEIAVMGPEGAANIIFRNEIATAADPAAVRRQKVAEYTEKFANPYVAAASGHVDAVITPADTRKFLIHSLQISSQKHELRPPKKHGIPPF